MADRPDSRPPHADAGPSAGDERLHRQLFDANPAPMWAFDGHSLRFLAVNEAVVASYGYDRTELLALTVRDVIPAASADRLAEEIAWGGAAPREALPWEHRTKVGALLPLEVTVSPFEHDGRPAWLAVGTDAVDRRRAGA